MSKLSWTMQDDTTIVATGSAGVGYVITAHEDDDGAIYTLHLPAGAYSNRSLVRLMLDAEAIEEHHAAKEAS